MASINIQLLNLLRETFYGNGKEYFKSLPPEQQQILCKEMMTAHLCCWCYRMLHDVLPNNARNQFRTNYLYRSAEVAKQQMMKEELFALFEDRQIRFAPIKGADLAFELYQEPVLRYFCDLDILLHPEDCERALAELTQAQWLEIPGQEQDEHHHHFTIRQKQHVALEPHKTLPRFKNVSITEIWQHIHPVKPGRFQHRLEPELRLLLLLRHASRHCEETLCKLLLDAAHILQTGEVDMKKLSNLSKGWALPYPGHFLAAFPEFFPETLLQQAGGTPEGAALYRQLFEQLSFCPDASPHLQAVSENLLHITWWAKQFGGMMPRKIRIKYHLPNRGAYFRLTVSWFKELFRKIVLFCKYIFHPGSFKKIQSISEEIDHYE